MNVQILGTGSTRVAVKREADRDVGGREDEFGKETKTSGNTVRGRSAKRKKKGKRRRGRRSRTSKKKKKREGEAARYVKTRV